MIKNDVNMVGEFDFDPRKTAQRLDALKTYFQTNVLDGEQFICQHYQACRDSHRGSFYEGQLHHIGNHYDVHVRGQPFRIIVVGQEYGHKPAIVSLTARSQMVLNETGLQKDFSQRNPHMRGVTSALRLLYGLPLDTNHETEFMQSGDQLVHLFDAFALVNYLLCSAVVEGEGRRGKATGEMLKNCVLHFRNTLQILEPTIMIVQSKGYWKSIATTFERVTRLTSELYRGHLADIELLVAVFTHPSTPDKSHNWGRNADTPYLHNTIEPAIAKLKSILFGVEPGFDLSKRRQTPSMHLPETTQFRGEDKMSEPILDYETFYREMQTGLRWLLPKEILSRHPDYKTRSNRMQVFLDQISGSHYEICLRQTYHEIALHFESTPERSLERRQAFDPLLKQFSDSLGRRVQSGKHENRGWMRVWIECPITPLTEKVLVEYTELFANFIKVTYPILEKKYK